MTGGESASLRDDMERFFARDHYLPHVTPEAVAEALNGFEVPCRYSMEWLAVAVRRALACTMRNIEDMPGRQSNADTRKELERLGKRAGKLWLAMFEGMSQPARDAVFDYAFRQWEGEGGTDIGDGLVIGEPALHRDFTVAVRSLDWLSGFLQLAAKDIESQPPRWTEAEWREIRIERAQYLAPVFQTATGVNGLTGLGDFYQRMVWLAFDEGDIPDFEALIGEARRRHVQAPCSFTPGVIPTPY